jgi:hypothetical protein
MYNFLFMAHSGWRWLVLLFVVVVAIKMLVGWLAKQKWTDLDMTLVRVTHIVVAIQVALGIILYILFLVEGGRGRTIGGFTGGHVVPALLAYGGVLFAAIRARKASSWPDKFKFAAIGLIAAIILIFGALMSVGGIFA